MAIGSINTAMVASPNSLKAIGPTIKRVNNKLPAPTNVSLNRIPGMLAVPFAVVLFEGVSRVKFDCVKYCKY